MPARYSSSAASSLYSQPVHSRASSRTAVVTPLEDFRTSRYIHADSLAPLEDPTRYNSRYSSKASPSSYERSSQLSSEKEPNGPYFSLPVDRTVPMTRRGTIKELVGKYEQLSSPTKSARPTVASSDQSSLATPESGEKKGKGKSPIRQSFRSLLSVFSKKGRLSKDLSGALTPDSLDDGVPISSLRSPSARKLEPLHIPTTSQAQKSATVACNTPFSLHSGRLFHMSRPSPDSFPVWTDCTVLLHPSHMLVTWMTSQSNPSTSIVTLAQCTDVRSLALADLVAEERDLLPSTCEPTELWIFELLFEGKAREKFAAVSIKERAAWVSAIWYAIHQILKSSH